MIERTRRMLLAPMLGLLLLPALSCRAGAANILPLDQYGMDSWDTSDGLPQTCIRAIVQTHDG
jgi:hypothetical protein